MMVMMVMTMGEQSAVDGVMVQLVMVMAEGGYVAIAGVASG